MPAFWPMMSLIGAGMCAGIKASGVSAGRIYQDGLSMEERLGFYGVAHSVINIVVAVYEKYRPREPEECQELMIRKDKVKSTLFCLDATIFFGVVFIYLNVIAASFAYSTCQDEFSLRNQCPA